MFCQYCGSVLKDGANFCSRCGKSAGVSEEALVEQLTSLEQPKPAPQSQNDMPTLPQRQSAPAQEAPQHVTQEAQQSQDTAVFQPQQETFDPFDPELESLLAPYQETRELPTPSHAPSKKWLIITLSALVTAIVLLVGLWFLYNHMQTSEAYEKAVSLRQQGQLSQALDAFRDLEDHKDSKTQAQEISQILEAEQLLNRNDYTAVIQLLEPMSQVSEAKPLLDKAYLMRDYDNALASLDAGEYDLAKSQFAALGDYLDSREYAEYKISYLQAQKLLQEAQTQQSAELYVQAALGFATLGDYAQAQEQVSPCYLQAALLYLSAGDPQTAQEYTGSLTEEDLAQFQQAFHAAYADADLLKAWEEALALRIDSSNNGSLDFSQEYNALAPYLDRTYLEAELQTAFEGYMDLLARQQALVKTDGSVSPYTDWLALELDRIGIVEALTEKGTLFPGSTKYQNYFHTQARVVAACQSIELSISRQLVGVSASQDEDGNYYVPYKNDTVVGFTLEYTHYFYRENRVYDTDVHTIELLPGQSVKIPINFPENEDAWDTWKSGYSYSDLKLDG